MAGRKGKVQGKPSVAQRKAQSARDKAKVANRPKRQKGAMVSTRKLPAAGNSAYTKLILDPCEAKLTSAPLPGRTGAQAMRVPFRAVITVPTATVGITGATTSGNQACTAVVATVFPHAMNVSTAPYASPIVLQGLPSETSATCVNSQSGWQGVPSNVAGVLPNGLNQLFAISSEIRPIAACIKVGYIGPQGQNSGAFIAYEGQASQLYGKIGSTSNTGGDISSSMALQVPLSNLALDAWTTCDTTKTVESRVNFAAADPYWQTFKPTSTPLPAAGAYTRGTGLLDSASLADPDLTGLPVGSVAISGAVPGTQYLLTGAIVYEWVPSVTLGMPPPQRTLRDPKVLQTVVNQLGRYGRMLVGLVADAGMGTPPGLMLDLAMKAFTSLAVRAPPQRSSLRIGM